MKRARLQEALRRPGSACCGGGGCSVVDLPGWVQGIPEAAIVGAAGAYGFREIEAWRVRKRELKGLLRLMAAEIEYNQKVLDLFIESPRAMEELAEEAGLLTQAWEENRARIAQLYKDGEDFQRLDVCCQVHAHRSLILP
jgi:hypothetical protein